MLRFTTKLALGTALLCAALTAEAKLTVPELEDLPILSQEQQHHTACSRTANYFIRAHYKTVEINDAFADIVIDRYLTYLDYNKSLYTQNEVDEIHNNRARILRALNFCDLGYPYELFNNASAPLPCAKIPPDRKH